MVHRLLKTFPFIKGVGGHTLRRFHNHDKAISNAKYITFLREPISFIIIGRNEGWKLTKCLESVMRAIKFNRLSNYEVFYVDSKSTDDSIHRAKRFKTQRCFN